MTYYFAKTLDVAFPAALAGVREALSREGFGVISEIDLQSTMQAKLGVEMPPYTILGACHPASAYAALQAENKIGLMLPCNVIVQEPSPGHAEVAAIDPTVAMGPIGNPALERVASDVARRLRLAIANTLAPDPA